MVESKKHRDANKPYVTKDSPDDFLYEGKQEPTKTVNESHQPTGDDAYVTIDNPDDFE